MRKKGDTEIDESIQSHLGDKIMSDAHAGKIVKLQMTNFMCHSNLELEFNEMINFITGRNGSGKSTIMAALIVTLGGTANLTGRGSGIADFIKKGETWAKVSITLNNEGINSFKKEVYGSKISICRNISKTGANTYLCKSESGGLISKKKEEVDNIVLAFNWQIKNPICVLNQDVARSFLCATDNEMRFTMFTKATQLDELKLIYIKTMELLSLTRQELVAKEKEVEEAHKEVLQIKEKLSLFLSIEKYFNRQRDLENEYLWSLVAEEERKLDTLIEKKSSLEAEKLEILNWISNYDTVMQTLKAEIQRYTDEKNEVKKLENNKKMERSNIQQTIQEIEVKMEKNENQMKLAISKLESKMKDINGVKEHLAQCDNNSSQTEKEKKKVKEKMVSLQENLQDVKGKILVAQKEYDAAQETKMHHLKKMENFKSELSNMEHNKKRLEYLSDSDKSKGMKNKLAKFGPFTQTLLDAIDDSCRKNLFYKKPVGPCGKYVHLSGDPKWARAVESVIGGLMTTYCCDNQKDFQVLTKIMDRVCGEKQPNIIISKFLSTRHNVESKKASLRDNPAIVDVLKFDNDVVFNMFIDQARIETIVLFETDKKAASVMTHIQNVPKNLKMGLTMASDQYYPAPNYRTYYGNSTAPLRYFDSVNKAGDSIKKIEEEVKLINQSIVKLNVDIVQVRQEYVESCNALTRLQESLKLLRQNERRIQVELNQLKDIEDSRPVTITKIALEEELSALQKNYEEASEKMKQYKETLESLRLKKEEHTTKLKTLAMERSDSEEQLKKLEEILDEKEEKRKYLLTEKKNSNNRVDDIDRKLQEIGNDKAKCEAEREKRMKGAIEVCPEKIETEKTPVEVQKLLEKCERHLKTAEKITGSKEDAINTYKSKLEAYKKVKRMVGVLKVTMDALVKTTGQKLERLKILQTHTANLVSFYFQVTLQTRGYDGQLKVDFDKKILDLEVTAKEGGDPRKDSKTLSGGERSYSTVSFILAVWKVVNMPVYFLDEFDVFMDRVNRKVIMDLLLEHATSQNHKQFIFITPQDISNIQASDLISIYKLPDPKRKMIES